MDTEFWTITIGNILLFGGTAAGFVYTWFSNARDRQWAKEDAARKADELAEKLQADAVNLAVKTSADTAMILQKTKDELAILSGKVEESIESSKAALKDSNNFNLKLATVNKDLADVTNNVRLLMEKFLTPTKKPRKRK